MKKSPSSPPDLPRDPQLLAALRHAPDHELAPPAALSERILQQARKAAKAGPRPGGSWWPPDWLAWLNRPMAAGALGSVLIAGFVGLMWRQGLPPEAEPGAERRLPQAAPADVPASAPLPQPTPPSEPAAVGPAPAPQAAPVAATELAMTSRPTPMPPPLPARNPPPEYQPRADAQAGAVASPAPTQAPAPELRERAPAAAKATADSALNPARQAAPALAPPTAAAAAPTPATVPGPAQQMPAAPAAAPARDGQALPRSASAESAATRPAGSPARMAGQASIDPLAALLAGLSVATDQALRQRLEALRRRASEWAPTEALPAGVGEPVIDSSGRMLGRLQIDGTRLVWQAADGRAYRATLAP